MSVNTICCFVGIDLGQRYHFRVPVDYYPVDSVLYRQNGKFGTGELRGVECQIGVFEVNVAKEPHAIGAYIRGSLASVVREDVMSLDRFIKLSLGR